MSMIFAEIGVRPELVAALAKQQITEPTAIQIAALPVLLAGKDAYLNAETGTGKTLAYLLPIFCRLDAKQEATQVLIVAPTHELAIQIQRQCCDLAQNAGWPIRSLLLIGGTSLDRQIDKLKKKPHIGVGSPGRIREHLYLVCEERDKPEVLRKLLHALRPQRAMVFVHRNETAEKVAAKLAYHQIPVADLHGASDKRDRKQAMDDFRSARVRVLIASD